MRFIANLIIIFILFGAINPLLSNTGYAQETVESDFWCESLAMLLPGTSFNGQGHVFRGYFVNIYLNRNGANVPSCSDEFENNFELAPSFMNWPE